VFVILIFLYFILMVPLACFSVAAVAEFRSDNKGAGLFLRIIEIAAGSIAVFALQSKFWGITGLSSAWLSWTMVFVSLLMGGLCLLSKYASRVALSFMLLGNGILAFFWYFNGAYHNVTDDRTGSIDWMYEWDIDDPVGRTTEEFSPGTVPKHGAIFFPPAVGQTGTIYLLRPHAYTDPKGLSLAAFDPGWLWEIRPNGGICTLPAIADDGTILFGTGADDDDIISRGLHVGTGLAWAVSPEGKKKWTYEFPPASFFLARHFGGGAVFPAKSPACSQPAVAADGTTYWLGHGVYALTSDGALRWAFEPGVNFYFVCIADDGTVYALADGALFALAPDGTQKWRYPFEKSEYFEGQLAIGTDGTIYLTNIGAGRGTALFALTPQGRLKWRNQSYEFRASPLVAPDGTIYQEVQDPRRDRNEAIVVALDPNGKTKWDTPDASTPLEVASDGTLYICYIRDLFAISRRGNMLWKAQLPENPDSPFAHDPTKAVTLAPNGKFHIGDFFGRLGTLDAPAGLATSGWPARFHDARNTARAGAH
jgi:hypothetical protein